jgi:hypothetical protein
MKVGTGMGKTTRFSGGTDPEGARVGRPLAPGWSREADDETEDEVGATYSCPMHPHVASDQPGSCPVCGMALVKKSGGGRR